jgi:hypothetical protein
MVSNGPKTEVEPRPAVVRFTLPAQPVDATQALNLSAGGFKLQGLTRPFVQLTSHFVQCPQSLGQRLRTHLMFRFWECIAHNALVTL